MAVPQRIPVGFGDVFPHGAYVLGVEPINDYDMVLAKAADPQQRDDDTGERLWAVRVVDTDPAARAGNAEVKVKIAAPAQPVPPEPLPGTPFRAVEFEGLTITPWVDQSRTRPRQAFSLRARSMRAVRPARATAGGAA
ncbi:MAG: plasmid replication, integration and excision activator [Frankia sp.]